MTFRFVVAALSLLPVVPVLTVQLWRFAPGGYKTLLMLPTKKLFGDALLLPPAERAKLVLDLSATLKGFKPSSEWEVEIAQRVQELVQGRVGTVAAEHLLTDDVTPVLERASRAFEQKKWADAVKHYRIAVERFPRNAPFDAFVRLATAQRNLGKSPSAKATIRRGLEAYPGNRWLLAEYAVLLMATEEWEQALDLWNRLHKKGRLSAPNYNRFAKTCEALQLWDLHEILLERANAQHPTDGTLALRKVYGSAVRAFDEGRWQAALDGFELLRGSSLRPYPVAVSYYTHQAALELELASLSSDEERRACLWMSRRIRKPLPEPADLTGLPNALRIAEPSTSAGQGLPDAILKLVNVSKQLEADIRSVRSKAHCDAVAELARCTSQESVSQLKLPAMYHGTLCQHLVRRGYLQPYWLFRSRLLDELQEGRLTEQSRPNFRDFVSQVTLANEEGDHDYFALLRGVFERCFPNAGSDQHLFMELSSQYHPRTPRLDDRFWSTRDREFASFVAGKSVAIVGPVASGEDAGEEIDSMNLVVRFNHRGSLQYDPRTFGQRTDLSWYAGDDFAKLGTPEDITAINSLYYVVVGDSVWDKCKWVKAITCRWRSRLESWKDEINPFVFGAPNGVQRVLHDLLRFDVGRVKVFHSNLLLSMDYISGYRKPVRDIGSTLVLHDPVANFAFLKRLLEVGALEVDGVLAKILELSRKSYVEELALRYGRA